MTCGTEAGMRAKPMQAALPAGITFVSFAIHTNQPPTGFSALPFAAGQVTAGDTLGSVRIQGA